MESSVVLCVLLAVAYPAEAQVPAEIFTCPLDLGPTQVDPNVYCPIGYPPISCNAASCPSNFCGCTTNNQLTATTFGGKLLVFANICTRWPKAQTICCQYGGRLWQPASSIEMTSVWSSLVSIDAGLQGCFSWLGVNNFDPLFGNRAFFATSPPPVGPAIWNTVNDGVDGNTQNCAFFKGTNPLQWRDSNCGCTQMPFICEFP